jgi:hypothetical protein
MADISATIESLENRFMQAWMHGDVATLRKLAARDSMTIVGTSRSQLLDRPSFVQACATDFRCTGFRFREVFVRKHGKFAWFAAGADLEMKLGRKDWSGGFLLTGLWRKTPVLGGWKLFERSLSRLDDDEQFGAAVHRLQLWH